MSDNFYFFNQRHNNNIQSLKSFKTPAGTRQSIIDNSFSNFILKFPPQKLIKIFKTKHISDPRSVFSQTIIVVRIYLLVYNLKICLKFVSQISLGSKCSMNSVQKNINHITTVKIIMSVMLSKIDRIIGYLSSF